MIHLHDFPQEQKQYTDTQYAIHSVYSRWPHYTEFKIRKEDDPEYRWDAFPIRSEEGSWLTIDALSYTRYVEYGKKHPENIELTMANTTLEEI